MCTYVCIYVYVVLLLFFITPLIFLHLFTLCFPLYFLFVIEPLVDAMAGASLEEKKEEVDTCAICLDDLIGSVNTVMTPCGHRFHCRCAITYVRKEMEMETPRERAECALCRTPIDDAEPVEVQDVEAQAPVEPVL